MCKIPQMFPPSLMLSVKSYFSPSVCVCVCVCSKNYNTISDISVHVRRYRCVFECALTRRISDVHVCLCACSHIRKGASCGKNRTQALTCVCIHRITKRNRMACGKNRTHRRTKENRAVSIELTTEILPTRVLTAYTTPLLTEMNSIGLS